MAEMHLKWLTEGDLPRYFALQWDYLCRDLFSEADTPEERAYFRSEEYRGEVRSHLRDGSLTLLALCAENAEAGYCQLLYEKGRARVMEFWLLPQHRKKGWGKAFWQAVEAQLLVRHVSFITLEAATGEAKAFWKKMGFANPKQEIMEKQLLYAGKTKRNGL